MRSGREILRDAAVPVDPLADRAAILAKVAPWADAADLLRLDTVVSRLKVELGVDAGPGRGGSRGRAGWRGRSWTTRRRSGRPAASTSTT